MPRALVLFSPRANAELDAARDWWAEHVGTRALDDAIARALDRLEQFPEIAPRVKKRSRWSTIRRYVLDGVGYHLYYEPSVDRRAIEVVCFWHERRRPPKL